MNSRVLSLTERALSDIQQQALYLSRERGAEFALVWTEALIFWLERLAGTGVQLGTAHPSEDRFRTFGYKRQATILAEFPDGELRIVRVYFAGQNWSV